MEKIIEKQEQEALEQKLENFLDFIEQNPLGDEKSLEFSKKILSELFGEEDSDGMISYLECKKSHYFNRNAESRKKKIEDHIAFCDKITSFQNLSEEEYARKESFLADIAEKCRRDISGLGAFKDFSGLQWRLKQGSRYPVILLLRSKSSEAFLCFDAGQRNVSLPFRPENPEKSA